MRTATLDLNSRGSFVDDLNSKPGIVMCRDALLHRSHEIQPAFFDSEKKEIHFSFFLLFFFLFCLGPVRRTCGIWIAPVRHSKFGLSENLKKFKKYFKIRRAAAVAPPFGLRPELILSLYKLQAGFASM